MSKPAKSYFQNPFKESLIVGVERIAAWFDVLNRINVFPVADGDTGRNLVISLSPLKIPDLKEDVLINKLLLSARGNAGNIFNWFLSGMLTYSDSISLTEACNTGRDLAFRAVSKPVSGTMLTVIDTLVQQLEKHNITSDRAWIYPVIDGMTESVKLSSSMNPVVGKYGVVDAGALACLLFMEGFLRSFSNDTENLLDINKVFNESLNIKSNENFDAPDQQYCIDAVIRLDKDDSDILYDIEASGQSIVSASEGNDLKIHLHADDPNKIIEEMIKLGTVVKWEEDNLLEQSNNFRSYHSSDRLRIVTDAAGSISRNYADKHGIVLLDSYVNIGDYCLPETYLAPKLLYDSMRKGIQASTSQASTFERYQHYSKIQKVYKDSIYICVGSFYTGNFFTVMEWKSKYDPEDQLLVIDSGSASGRLGIAIIAINKFVQQSEGIDAVFEYSKKAVKSAEEYVFLDKLSYLAAGGRLSKTKALVGDVFSMKPVISPTPTGAQKVGLARNIKDQVRFALKALDKFIKKHGRPLVMLEYTDNEDWVVNELKTLVETHSNGAEIVIMPMSLTSGVHMGPGTWGIAFMPLNIHNEKNRRDR